MLGLLVIGAVILIVGKVKLTKSIVLVGKPARSYAKLLMVSSIPFQIFVAPLVTKVTPLEILLDPIWSRVLNYGLIIVFLLLLVIPYRKQMGQPSNVHPENPSTDKSTA